MSSAQELPATGATTWIVAAIAAVLTAVGGVARFGARVRTR